MTGDDREEFVRIVEEGLLGLAEESLAPPADLSARIRDRVTRRRRRGAFKLSVSVAALACAAAVPIGWSAVGESSKAAADSVAAASPPPTAATGETEAPTWWPLTDDRFTRINPSPVLTDFWDARTKTRHSDVRALKTALPFGDRSLILLVGHGSNGTARIGLMAGFVLRDGTVSREGEEFIADQAVTSPSAPIAIAAYPSSDSRSMSLVTIVAPPCPDHWRITAGRVGGGAADVAYNDDGQGGMRLTKMVPPQSVVTTYCATETFRFGSERPSVATGGTNRFELLAQQ